MTMKADRLEALELKVRHLESVLGLVLEKLDVKVAYTSARPASVVLVDASTPLNCTTDKSGEAT